MRGIHRGPVNSPHKGPVTRKMFPFDDVIMDQIKNSSHPLAPLSWYQDYFRFPDSKAHGANMGPTWVLSAPDGPHVVPKNLAINVVSISTKWSYHCFRRWLDADSGVITSPSASFHVNATMKNTFNGAYLKTKLISMCEIPRFPHEILISIPKPHYPIMYKQMGCDLLFLDIE